MLLLDLLLLLFEALLLFESLLLLLPFELLLMLMELLADILLVRLLLICTCNKLHLFSSLLFTKRGGCIMLLLNSEKHIE